MFNEQDKELDEAVEEMKQQIDEITAAADEAETDSLAFRAQELMNKVSDSAQEGARQLKEKYDEFKESETFQNASESFQKTFDDLKDKGGDLALKVKEATENFGSTAKETTEDWLMKAKEAGADFSANAKESTQEFVEKAKESTEEFVTKAKESTDEFVSKAKEVTDDLSAKASVKLEEFHKNNPQVKSSIDETIQFTKDSALRLGTAVNKKIDALMESDSMKNFANKTSQVTQNTKVKIDNFIAENELDVKTKNAYHSLKEKGSQLFGKVRDYLNKEKEDSTEEE